MRGGSLGGRSYQATQKSHLTLILARWPMHKIFTYRHTILQANCTTVVLYDRPLTITRSECYLWLWQIAPTTQANKMYRILAKGRDGRNCSLELPPHTEKQHNGRMILNEYALWHPILLSTSGAIPLLRSQASRHDDCKGCFHCHQATYY